MEENAVVSDGLEGGHSAPYGRDQHSERRGGGGGEARGLTLSASGGEGEGGRMRGRDFLLVRMAIGQLSRTQRRRHR